MERATETQVEGPSIWHAKGTGGCERGTNRDGLTGGGTPAHRQEQGGGRGLDTGGGMGEPRAGEGGNARMPESVLGQRGVPRGMGRAIGGMYSQVRGTQWARQAASPYPCCIRRRRCFLE